MTRIKYRNTTASEGYRISTEFFRKHFLQNSRAL